METAKTTIAACETQPVTAEGLKCLLRGADGLEWAGTVETLAEAARMVEHAPPDILVLDKAFGVQAVLDWIAGLKSAAPAPRRPATQFVVWGLSITESEALRFLQIGARGIVRKTADIPTVLGCFRAVASGSSWMEDSLFREASRNERYPRSELTPREQQVMELVEQGHKNKEIARQLGIRPGTVKIHLKHIFEKTGVRGRYGLALSGMKEKGILAFP